MSTALLFPGRYHLGPLLESPSVAQSWLTQYHKPEMFIFAHLGITAGGTLALHKLASAVAHVPREKPGANGASSLLLPIRKRLETSSPATWIDYRLILLGSMLPDIIDKPLGIWLFGNGISIAHTFVFSMVLMAASFTVYTWRRRTGLLCLYNTSDS